VRLLNADHAAFADVEAFFIEIVQPVVESELGYKMLVVDGDQEIFEKLPLLPNTHLLAHQTGDIKPRLTNR
jgi:hypothetical protein